MEARLVVVGGKANKSEVRLKLPAMIGRSRDSDVTVSHASVSRHHCLIYELEGALVVRDNGSLNGTVIDGEKVQESLLKPGQSLTIGPLTFRAEYEHGGIFPVIGAPAEANGQAHPSGLPSTATDALASEADEGTIQMEAAAVEELLPDLDVDSEPVVQEAVEEQEADAGEFDFLADEPADEPATTSKPSFSFLGGDDAAESADEDDSGAIFRIADDPPQPASPQKEPKEKQAPAAASDESTPVKATAAKSTAAKEPAAGNEDAALDDFLNSLGLEE